MTLQKWAWVFGIVLTLVGILGFVPGITTDDFLLGIFKVDTVHNIIHLVSGLIALYAARKSAEASKVYFKTFGIIYAIVAVVGLIQGETVLGLFTTNGADHGLHVVIAVIALYLGFKKESLPAMTS